MFDVQQIVDVLQTIELFSQDKKKVCMVLRFETKEKEIKKISEKKVFRIFLTLELLTSNL